MKVALVHDDLVQWGGAERVLVAISELFPDAPIYTSVYDSNHPILKEQFKDKKIITSFIQKIPNWKPLYRTLLPIYPIIFEQFDFSDYDLVISQTTRFAKSIITKPSTIHICYCHTPVRFLWGIWGEEASRLMHPYLSFLRVYDRVSAQRVDKFLAGSINSQKRIKDFYQRDSKVVYPFVDLDRFKDIETFDGGYLLVISRLNKYKRIDLAIQASQRLNKPLKIVGEGLDRDRLEAMADPGLVEFLGLVSEKTLTQLLAGCEALVVCAEEDFGLTPLEAQALGKPVVGYRLGGTAETIIHGKTGCFFEYQNVESLTKGIDLLDKMGVDSRKCLEQAQFFSKERFLRNFKMAIQDS